MKRKVLLSILCTILSLAATAQTKIIAHRGCWEAENSAQNFLSSLYKANEIGCYGSEFDVWKTQNDVLVVHHDGEINSMPIEKSPYEKIRNCKLSNGETLPTLEQNLVHAKNCSELRLIPEIESSTTEQAGTESYAPKGSIRDMVLIYDGGTHRREVWNEELFQPYVYAPHQDGKGGDWLFDGFLFLEIYDGNRCGFASGYRPTPATKEDWIMLLDKYFTSGRSICALNDCIENAKSICGKLPKKRKIVLSLPEPIPNQKNWGEINGKKLDFSNDEDRISACKWYIELIAERFKKAHLKNVELAGFYWLAEEATHTRTFVKHIADYIHKGNKSFYWIPYFKSDGYTTWKELGFDKAYLQPNHFFNLDIPDSRIDDACKLARQYGMSMEFEFDERVLQERAPRMQAYIDGFIRNHVFENTDIAYYQGGSALYALKSGSEKDVALYYQLANLIIKRQKAEILKDIYPE